VIATLFGVLFGLVKVVEGSPEILQHADRGSLCSTNASKAPERSGKLSPTDSAPERLSPITAKIAHKSPTIAAVGSGRRARDAFASFHDGIRSTRAPISGARRANTTDGVRPVQQSLAAVLSPVACKHVNAAQLDAFRPSMLVNGAAIEGEATRNFLLLLWYTEQEAPARR
jgi:hypothetical protein